MDDNRQVLPMSQASRELMEFTKERAEGYTPIEICQYAAMRWANDALGMQLKPTDMFCVWFSYTLGNFKALVGSRAHDDRYYEVTHNAASGEIYVDTYKKTHNVAFFLTTPGEEQDD